MPELKIDHIKTIEKKLAENIGLLSRQTISSWDVLKNHVCFTYSFIFKLCKHSFGKYSHNKIKTITL